jgi:glycosyltransferase involved in cell wall biosynthesis
MNDSMTEFKRTGPAPALSICVMQHNRTSFFLRAIASYATQSFRDFEICVSEGGSTDGRENEVLDTLRATGIPFVYRRSDVNLRYDPNTRTAIGLARGRYCLLMGNDDALNGPEALAELWSEMQGNDFPGVVLNDSCDDRSGLRAMRIRDTRNYGSGPRVAAKHYRNFSFVSGVVLEREPVQAMATDKWDGSEMYQTYVGSRLIASGRPLLERGVAFSRKDIVVPGEDVDSVSKKPVIWPCPIVERPTTLTQFARLVGDAIAPYAGSEVRKFNESILIQHLGITVPYWLFTYRRIQSWRYAVGVAMGLKPSRSAAGMPLGWFRSLRVWALYLVVVFTSLTIPQSVYQSIELRLYRFAKSYRK